jgi:hypothetical protein
MLPLDELQRRSEPLLDVNTVLQKEKVHKWKRDSLDSHEPGFVRLSSVEEIGHVDL